MWESWMHSGRRFVWGLAAVGALLAPASRATAAPGAPTAAPATPAPPPAKHPPPAPAKTPTAAAKPGKSATGAVAAAAKPSPRAAARAADANARRQVAGGPTADDVAAGADTPELRALYAAEVELFPPALPPLGIAWPSELPFPLAAAGDLPRVHASGVPPAPVPTAP